MSRAIRSAYAAHESMRDAIAVREAIATWPRSQSVRLLHVRKRRRELRRERVARALCVALISGALPALFLLFTRYA